MANAAARPLSVSEQAQREITPNGMKRRCKAADHCGQSGNRQRKEENRWIQSDHGFLGNTTVE
jgi:hypothetical protein